MEKKENNIFVRILIVGLISFMTWIIAYSFLSIEPKGSISTGIITLIVLLVVIILSESFDNFSIARLLTMSRDIASKNNSIQKLDFENTELRRELVNVVTSISQNQSSTNIIGLSDDLARKIGVEKATEDEITNKLSEENEELSNRVQVSRTKINFQKLEEIAMSKFLMQQNLSEFNLIKEAKLVTKFSGIDEVSNIHPIYDGYISTGKSEIFIEVRPIRKLLMVTMLREKLYLLLNKIYLYNKIKNANAHLNLVLVPLKINDDDENLVLQRGIDRIKEFFEPAIVKGILRIIVIELDENDIALICDS